MADLKTTNIYGDAYINNKVGINTNTPATRLQIGQLSPTAATEGLQFGDDTAARLHRINTGHIRATGGISSATFIIADNYLQTNNNLIYPSSQAATQRLEVGNASGNAWIDGLTIAQGGNVTVYNNLTVNGNTYLGDANGDTVFVNDTIRIGATDSGDASLFFGEGSVAGSDYGARWYWDSGFTFTWYTRNAGTDTALFDYVTNDLSYINWRRHFHMQNKEINYNAQIHFNAGTRFVGSSTEYLIFRSDSNSVGGIQIQSGNTTLKGYIGYWDSGGGGILNNTGNWAVRYNFGSANSGGQLYGAWTVSGNISATNLSGTNTGDQTVGNGTITIAAGTGVGVASNTFTTNQTGNSTVTISNTGVTSLAGTANRITVSGATGAVTLNLPQDIHTGASPSFTGLTVTGITMTNLTGAYQNTTVYNTSNAQSATPNRGIRAPASSIQFTDSYAIAPFFTFRSTGDWPVPYGIGWGTGGESSGIFQRFASNNYSFGDMIFYIGNDGFGAFSFRRHTWEGATYFAAGSGELNTELFRIDWAGKATAISFALPGGFTITDPGSGYASFNNWVQLGTTGFYSSTNGAHIYPNNGSYGSWGISGTRNGWGGIEFGNNGVSLMMGSDTVGFHQNSNGWLFRVHNGSGFIYKGSWGGGIAATILDSSNYNSFAPTLTGTGASGTWSINVTGNAATATNGFTVKPGWAFNQNVIVGLANFNNSVPSGFYEGYQSTNAPSATWYNLINVRHSNPGNDHGFQLAMSYYDENLWSRTYQGGTGANNGTFTAWRLHLHSGNYNSFAPTLTGTGASGTWAINVTGNAATVTNGIYTTNYYTGTPLGKRRLRIHPSDSTSLNSSITNLECGFTYGGSGEPTGPFIAFGGLGGAIDYSCQLVGAYSGGGNDFKIRTRNDDNSTWNAWRTIITDGNYTSYSPSLTGTGASGTWAINVTGNAVTAGGLAVHTGTNNEANKIVRTQGDGYIMAGWINTISGDMPDTQSIDRIYCSADGFIRFKGVSDFKQQINLTYKNATPRSANTTDTNYWTGVMGWDSTDWNLVFDWGSGFTDSWGGPANRPGDTTHHLGIQSVHYTNGSSRYGWQMVNGAATGRWWLRDVWGGGFNSWREVLHSLNFNSFAPTLTGTGASGTWSINVTGNAVTAGGLAVQTGNNYEANKIVRTQENGYIHAGWINTISGDNSTVAIDKVYASNDNYIRYYSPANFRTVLDVPTRNGGGVTNFGINIAPSNRLHINGDGTNPPIRIDNTTLAGGASNTRGFLGWLPISLGGTTRYIQIYT